MLKSFLPIYSQGYADGLWRATALTKDHDTPRKSGEELLDAQCDERNRPAYQEGFLEGFRDGLEVLTSMPRASLAPGWSRTIRQARDLVTIVFLLQKELRRYYQASRLPDGQRDAAAAKLHLMLTHAESLIDNCPLEGTDTVLDQRWAYVQLITLVESARRVLTRHKDCVG